MDGHRHLHTWSLWRAVKPCKWCIFSEKIHDDVLVYVCLWVEFMLCSCFFLSSCSCFAIDDMYRLSLINSFCEYLLYVHCAICKWVCLCSIQVEYGTYYAHIDTHKWIWERWERKKRSWCAMCIEQSMITEHMKHTQLLSSPVLAVPYICLQIM